MIDLITTGAWSAPFELVGRYRISSDTDVEVELLDQTTLSRHLVYIKPNKELVLFIPKGRYSFYVCNLAEGAVQIKLNALVKLTPLGFLATLVFYSGRALGLLKLSPSEVMARVQGFLHRALKGGAHRLIAAQAQVEGANLRDDIIYTRDVLLPENIVAADQAVSIIIPTKTQSDLLRACITSLGLIRDVRYEIIIVDNGATDVHMLAYLAALKTRSDVQILRRDMPFNFSHLCNDGARLANYPTLLFLNDDIEALDGDWLKHMCGFAARSDVGVVGARLLYATRHLQHGGIASNLVPGPGHPWRGVDESIWSRHPLLAQAGEVDAVTGACLMIRKDHFEAVGGFDEVDFTVTLNDVDICLKVRQLGLKVVYVPQATLLHKESQSRLRDDHSAEAARYQCELAAFYRRHTEAAEMSCFYPPNLRRDSDAARPI